MALAAAPGRVPVTRLTWRRWSLRVERRSVAVCLGLVAASLVVGAFTLATGDYPVSVPDVVRTLAGQGDPAQQFIIESLRAPRLLTGLAVGAALGIGGALFQSLSRNPLGSPDVVGFDTGAATGALLVIVAVHGSTAQVAAGSIAGGLVTALLVYLLAMKRGVQGYRLILIGIGVAAMLTAANHYLITRANLVDAQAAYVWLTGSLNGRGWEHAGPMAAALALSTPLAVWVGRDLRMLEQGDDTAAALGVRAERTRLLGVVVGVGLTAAAVAAAGPIPFIALSAPQVARRLTRVPGPGIVPAALTGALLVAASDLAAQRVFAPTQLPVGVATGVLGGAYLAWLLTREWRGGRG